MKVKLELQGGGGEGRAQLHLHLFSEGEGEPRCVIQLHLFSEVKVRPRSRKSLYLGRLPFLIQIVSVAAEAEAEPMAEGQLPADIPPMIPPTTPLAERNGTPPAMTPVGTPRLLMGVPFSPPLTREAIMKSAKKATSTIRRISGRGTAEVRSKTEENDDGVPARAISTPAHNDRAHPDLTFQLGKDFTVIVSPIRYLSK